MSQSKVAPFAFAIAIVALGVFSCSRWVRQNEQVRLADKNHFSECVLGKLGDVSKEILCSKFLESRVGTEDQNAEALDERSLIYSNEGKCEAALKDAEEAFKNSLARASALRARGAAKFCSGDSAGAVVDLTLAIDISPDAAEFYGDRARFYENMGDKDKAIADKVMEEKLRGKH